MTGYMALKKLIAYHYCAQGLHMILTYKSGFEIVSLCILRINVISYYQIVDNGCDGMLFICVYHIFLDTVLLIVTGYNF